MPQQKDAVSEFMALPQDQQVAMLKQLPRENQDRLLAQVKARRQALAPKAVAIPGVTYEMRAAPSGIPAPPEDDPWKGHRLDETTEKIRGFLTRNAPAILGTVGGMAMGGLAAPAGALLAIPAGMAGAGAGGAAGAAPGERWKQAAEQAAWQLGGEIPGMAFRSVRALAQGAKALAPEMRVIEGEAIPQLAGEAAPQSLPGRMQRMFKAGGESADKFAAVEGAQQEGAKGAIRKASEAASVSPVAETEPWRSTKAGANALRKQADPLYGQVRGALVHVPFDARSFLQEGPVLDAWNAVMRRDGVSAEQAFHPNQPIGRMQEFRSQLAKMADADRNAITGRLGPNGVILKDAANQVEDMMRTSMEKKSPAALKAWEQANSLWKRSIALDKVSHALADVTKGTEPGMQAGTALPTEIQGASLVKQLNELDRKGDLGKAFPDGGKALHAVADLLDRAQRTPVGREKFRQLYLAGKYGTYIALAGGAGILEGRKQGAKAGFETFAAAALLAGIGEHYGTKALVNLMTDPDGAKALKGLADSTTYAQVTKWGSRVSQMAATAGRIYSSGPVPSSMPAPRTALPTPPNPTDAWASTGSQ